MLSRNDETNCKSRNLDGRTQYRLPELESPRLVLFLMFCTDCRRDHEHTKRGKLTIFIRKRGETQGSAYFARANMQLRLCHCVARTNLSGLFLQIPRHFCTHCAVFFARLMNALAPCPATKLFSTTLFEMLFCTLFFALFLLN